MLRFHVFFFCMSLITNIAFMHLIFDINSYLCTSICKSYASFSEVHMMRYTNVHRYIITRLDYNQYSMAPMCCWIAKLEIDTSKKINARELYSICKVIISLFRRISLYLHRFYIFVITLKIYCKRCDTD